MSEVTHMMAPKGTKTATILGHQYKIPADGKIQVVSADHFPVLKRHGFTDTDAEDYETLVDKIENTDDKDWLVEFIEEHGGEADTSMSMKKLRKAAKAALDEEAE